MKIGLLPSDYEAEDKQIDGILAHALERLFGRVSHILSDSDMFTTDGSNVNIVTDN